MALSKTTQDHDEIRQWAEKRGAVPADVADTESNGQTGIIRLEFPKAPNANDSALKEISWDAWFEKFDASGLALVYQDLTADGEQSNFNKLIHAEADQAPAKSSARKSPAKKAAKKPAAKSAAKKAAKKPASKAPAKKTVKAPAKKSVTARSSSRPAATKSAAKKSAAKKSAATKAPAKKASAKKAPAKKTAGKKASNLRSRR